MEEQDRQRIWFGCKQQWAAMGAYAHLPDAVPPPVELDGLRWQVFQCLKALDELLAGALPSDEVAEDIDPESVQGIVDTLHAQRATPREAERVLTEAEREEARAHDICSGIITAVFAVARRAELRPGIRPLPLGPHGQGQPQHRGGLVSLMRLLIRLLLPRIGGMVMAKKALPPAVEAQVEQALRLTDWSAIPDRNERVTRYRAAKEQITARVLADLATEQARQRAAQERAAQAEQARYGHPGGRYGA